MFKSFFGTKEILEFNFEDCKIYKTKYNNNNCTKISFYREINSGKIGEVFSKIKNLSEDGILPIYRITPHSIYSKKVIPFSTIFSKRNEEFNKFVIFKIARGLESLHKNEISHNNLKKESFFIDEIGNPLLGNFVLADFAKNEEEMNSDKIHLDSISIEICGCHPEDISSKGIYFKIEEGISKFEEYDLKGKKEFMGLLLNHKKYIIESIKNNMFNLFIQILKSNIEKQFKTEILDFLKEFDGSIFIKNQVNLFKVIDSSVRFYLLSNADELDSLDGAVEEIGLGLRVKDKSLRIETISFIFKNASHFGDKSIIRFIELMGSYNMDSDSIGLICHNLSSKTIPEIEPSGLPGYHKNLYKMFVRFLFTGKNKTAVYSCIATHFQFFNKYKLSSEMLPLLCSKLCDKEGQDSCFALIEKILNFLKANKNDLENKEWSIMNFTGFFKTKARNSEQDLKEKLDKMYGNEWEEQEL